MTPTPYITFKGQCREAMTAYQSIFGGQISIMMTGAEMPGAEIPADKAEWIMHSELKFDDGRLMASDDMMGHLPPVGGAWVMMEMPSLDAAKAAFDALADGGEVMMPFAPSSWSEGFGMVTDRFGIPWMISAPSQMG